MQALNGGEIAVSYPLQETNRTVRIGWMRTLVLQLSLQAMAVLNKSKSVGHYHGRSSLSDVTHLPNLYTE